MHVNELRKILRDEFNKKYSLKTRTISSLQVKVANIYKGKKHIVGANANVYVMSQIDKHRKIFELWNKVKEKGLHDNSELKILM